MNYHYTYTILFILLLGIIIFVLSKKLKKGKIIYLETSAINHLAQISSEADAIATKKYHIKQGNTLLVSVVSIWEILMTSDDTKRENLIFYMQSALYNKLIFSPSELIINFIEAGCPEYEPIKSTFTNLPIGKVWEDICQNNKKTFVFNYGELKTRTKSIQKLLKRIDRTIKETVLDTEENKSKEKKFADSVYNNLALSKAKDISKEDEKIFKLSIIFISVVLCAGIGFDNTPIEDFWSKIGISNTQKRLIYICEHYEILIHRGPFFLMALMAYNQILKDKKTNRGLFWDALHCLYLPYIDILLTKDKHFKELQKINHPNFKKIVLIKENTIIKRKVK